MSLNKEYGESMDAGVKDLIEHSEFNKATNHVKFSTENLEMPEGVSEESLKQHVSYINELSSQVEVATAQIARDQRKDNDQLTTVDGTLDLGSFTINSQHHLQQKVGEEHIYGVSSTAIDYVHSDEQAQWLQSQRTASQEQAAKLFG